MGNHLVGQMFVSGVASYSPDAIDSMSSEEAMTKLETIGELVVKSTSLDAEFDDSLNPNEKLGSMVIKAFHPSKYNEWKTKPFVDEEIDEEYYTQVYKPFREKFGFW